MPVADIDTDGGMGMESRRVTVIRTRDDAVREKSLIAGDGILGAQRYDSA